MTKEEITAAVVKKIDEEKILFLKEKSKPKFTDEQIQDFLDAEQDGDAAALQVINRDRFLFDHATSLWHYWAVNYWREDRLQGVIESISKLVSVYVKESKRLADRRIDALKAEQKDQVARIKAKERQAENRLKVLQKWNWKKDILHLSSIGEKGLGTTGDEWDCDPMLIGCQNGVVDLAEQSFRDGKPSDLIKTPCPTTWISFDTPAPIWEQFLFDIFGGDILLIEYIQRLLGYSIAGLTIEHILPIFYGLGRNGKGTLLEIINYVLGSLSGPIQAEMLLEQKYTASSRGPSADIMGLRGKRLVWASETNEGRKLNNGKVKWLIGGDTLVGRSPYGKYEVSYSPTHTLFLMTNHKPQVNPNDFSVWSKLHLIPFNIQFVDEPAEANQRKREPLLLQRLKCEASGILSWLVNGFFKYQEQGLNPPAVVKAATEEYRVGEDILGHFLEDSCSIQKEAEIKAGDLYKAYQKWCENNGHKSLSGTKFGTRMKERFEHKKTRFVYYQGVSLNEQV